MSIKKLPNFIVHVTDSQMVVQMYLRTYICTFIYILVMYIPPHVFSPLGIFLLIFLFAVKISPPKIGHPQLEGLKGVNL